MMFLAVVAALGLASSVVAQDQYYTVWYDTFYDDGSNSLWDVACSNGQNGLIPYGYEIFSDIPTFPFIGGAPSIQSWNSTNCGLCWQLGYTNRNGRLSSIVITAINSGTQDSGFIISKAAMNALTIGNTLLFDGATITAMQVTSCGVAT